jgi:hypothetical protein
MSHLRVAKTVFFIALAASRNPMVRHAIRQAPKMIPEQHKKAAFNVAKGAARKAGEFAGRHIPPNRFF